MGPRGRSLSLYPASLLDSLHPVINYRITLASASPRRRDLLAQIGIDTIVAPVDADEESVDPGRIAAEGASQSEIPRIVAMERALLKARDATAVPPTSLVLASDTVVARDGVVYDKPVDRDDAKRMLSALSGGSHTVCSAVVITHSESGEALQEIAETVVTFGSMSEDEIEMYLDTEEWRGVAGAYRIQGAAAAFITSIHGSHPAVMGLPIHTVYSMIRRFFNPNS